ncbi:MAG: tetratricopeptide repeat protein, partial [Saprospiraceae bacterium]|nr:tetratricopeptide repeat protein [Saprospiraceae bacterium]
MRIHFVRLLLIASVLVWAVGICLSQSDFYPDSLLQVINSETASDANQKEAMLLLGEHWVQREPERAEELVHRLVSLQDTPTDSIEWARIAHIHAASHRWQGNYTTALDLYESIYRFFKRTGDPLNVARSGRFLGSINTFLGNNVIAQNHLLECAEIYDSIGSEEQKAGINSSLAGLYLNLDQVEEALARYESALQSYEASNDSAGIALINCNLGLVYSEEGELEKAEAHLAKMKPYTRVFPTERELGFYHDFLGILRQQQGRLRDAHREHLRALEIRKKLSSTYNLCESRLNVGEVLIKMKRPADAVFHFQDVLSYEEHQSLHHQSRAHSGLSDAYEAMGNHEKALASYKDYTLINDSIYNAENADIIADKDAQYQKREKDAEIALLSKENEVNEQRLRISKIISYGSMAGVLLFSLLAFSIFRLNQKLKSQNQLISETLKDKSLLIQEIHHRVKNNLQVISSLLNLQSKFIEDKNAMQAIKDGRNRVQSMALLHQNLYRENDVTGVNMQVYFTNLVRSIFNSYNLKEEDVALEMDIDDINLDVDQVIPLGLITNELITNSLKYAFQESKESARINVALREMPEEYSLTVSDNGIGMDGDTLEALP